MEELRQLNIEIDKKLLEEIKIRAIKRNITTKAWVVRAIIEAIKNEDKYKK